MAELPLEEVRALLSRLATKEDEMAAERTEDDLRSDPAWLQLPPAKRDVTLTRHKVLRAFDEKKTPTRAEAIAAAAELNVQLRTFYALLRDWRDKGRSALSLVPYGADEGSVRPSRLEAPVAERLTQDVRALLADNPSIRPGEAVQAVHSTWPATLKRPSSVTVRNYLERLKAEQPPPPGSLKVTLGSSPREKAETSSRFGEVLVIDHTSPARLLLDQKDGKTATVPTITLAIDLWSGVPIGASVNGGDPGPEGLLNALADARARVNGFGSDVIRPRIVYASTPDLEWDRLRDALMTDGLEIVEHRDHRLRRGGFAKRLIGSKLDNIQLQALRSSRPGVDCLDANENALLTIRQMRFVMDAALDRLVDRRLKQAVDQKGGGLDLPERIALRGTLKEQWVPLIDLRGDSLANAEDGAKQHCADGTSITNDQQAIEDELRAIVAAAAGPLLVDVDVRAPEAHSPGWAVSVSVNDGFDVPALWLRLAREAVRLFDMRGITVRFAADATPDSAGLQART